MGAFFELDRLAPGFVYLEEVGLAEVLLEVLEGEDRVFARIEATQVEMAAAIGGVTLVKIEAGPVVVDGNVNDAGIGDGLALCINDRAGNAGAVGADDDVQVSVGADLDAGVGNVAAVEIDGLGEVIAEIVGPGADDDLVRLFPENALRCA